MSEYIVGFRKRAVAAAAMVMLTVGGFAACGGKDNTAALNSDSTLGRDLAMAQADSVEPKLQDVPPPVAETPPAAATAPAKPTQKPAAKPTPKPAPQPEASATAPAAPAKPAAAEPIQGVVAAGTTMQFTASSKVCSNTVSPGDKFTGTLSQSVSASNGVQIPEGATAVFEITDAKTAKNSNDDTYLRVRLVSVEYAGKTYAVNATVQSATTDRVRSASKGTDAKKVVGGAILGAVAGQIIGKNTKGTVVGAAAGAAAGTAAAAATADYDTCVNSGAAITVVLDAPVTVRPAPTP